MENTKHQKPDKQSILIYITNELKVSGPLKV